LPRETLGVAERAAARTTNTLFPVTTLVGGTPAEVATLCQRLLPARVATATLEQIIADDASHPYRPGS
jgi:hypothetical protein